MAHTLGSYADAAIAGPWVAESRVCADAEERGLAVVAVLPELARTPDATPTRGMVAWVYSGSGACRTDAQAVATAHLIAAAPDLLAALTAFRNDIKIFIGNPSAWESYDDAMSERLRGFYNAANAAIAKAERD